MKTTYYCLKFIYYVIDAKFTEIMDRREKYLLDQVSKG